MNKFTQRLGDNASRIYILCLALFAAVTAVFFEEYTLAIVEGAVSVILLIVHMALQRRQQKELMQYIQSVTYDTEAARDNAMMNFPLPMAAYFADSGRLVWGNQQFFAICGRKEPLVNTGISDLVPGYQGKWLLEGKVRCPGLVEVGGRRYQVHGNLVRGQEGERVSGTMGITYWVDVTDYDDTRLEYEASRPVVMLLMIDNYDELMKNVPERTRNEMRSLVEDKFAQWTEDKKGFLRRYDRDRYIYLCERRYFDQLAAEKFAVLDAVREIKNTSGIHATVSIGAGLDGASLEEDFNFASMSVEMALSRGGDQAVVRNRVNFEFFGGKATEVETRTKVKSRVVANALSAFIKDASTTYIMGHRYADMDAMGAAVGLCCIARAYGKRARIVLGSGPNACGLMMAELKKHKEYEDIFVAPKEAMLQANSRSLLVVVDTNRPEQVEDEALLQTISRLVIIDHHRRAATYIDNAALTFHEPYASSASELVAELMQELVDQDHISRFEADALLAGMVTDTKNFTIRTGERTFEAAAFLRRMGADTVAVKRMLQSDMAHTVGRYAILERSRIYRDNICLAVMDREVDRVVAAQAADEMLNISDVEASMVLYPVGDDVYISARSIGSMNVQVVLEKLGGGGNTSAAGAQMSNVTVREAEEQLKQAIDEYLAS